MTWQHLYPFKAHFMESAGGHRMHYVMEGTGAPMVMLHGNPTWSFMYRNLIPMAANAGYCAIAPDLIGCGLSDKPQDWDYCLEKHIEVFSQLVEEELKLEKMTLVLHDWGGGVGMGYAVRHPEKIERIVLMNTAAFPSLDVPKRIYLCRIPLIGSFIVRGLNALVLTALRRGPARPMPADVVEGYRYPYRNWHDRVGVLSFPNDIPLDRRHRTWAVLEGIEAKLPCLADKPLSLIWGGKDFCFHTGFMKRWQQIFPNARTFLFENASHYLLEDEGERIIPLILGKE